jgi:predicted HTH transcriptional regulator
MELTKQELTNLAKNLKNNNFSSLPKNSHFYRSRPHLKPKRRNENENKKLILKLLKQNGMMSSSELLNKMNSELLNKMNEKIGSSRTLRRYLKELVEQDEIVRERNGKTVGLTYNYSINVS